MENTTTVPLSQTPPANFADIRGLFINDSLNQKERLFSDHIEAMKTYPKEYSQMLNRILANNVELSLGTKARVLAACLAMHNHELADKLVSRSAYNFTMSNTFGIAEVTKALSVLDTRRKIKALEKNLLRLQQRKAPPSAVAPVKTLLNSLIEKEKVPIGSVSGSVSRWAARWTASIPKHELEFYALCMPKQPWKDLADLVHLKPTDFQHSWFLDYVFDRNDKAEQWKDTVLGECNDLKKLNTRELVDLLRRRHVPYSLLRRVFLTGSDKDKDEDDDKKPARGARGSRGGARGGARGGRGGARGGARGGRGGARGGARGGVRVGRGGRAVALTDNNIGKNKKHKKKNRKNKKTKKSVVVTATPALTVAAVEQPVNGAPAPEPVPESGAVIVADKPKKKKASKPLPKRVKLSKRIRRAVLTYETIDIVLWWYDELHIGDEGDRIIANRFAYGDFPKLSYGKIMERVLYFKESQHGKLFYENLLTIAQKKLSGLNVPISPPACVIGDASGSMEVAIKTSTILSSILCAVSNADLVFFDASVIKPPCIPRDVAQVLEVAEKVKTRGATHNAIGLWKYYARKIPLKFVFMVTDEEENGSAHGYRFNALFKKYREEVAPDCKLVYVSFLHDPKKPGKMVREAIKPEMSLQPLQFRLNLQRPDLTKVDSWLGLLALESRTFDEPHAVTFKHVAEKGKKVSLTGSFTNWHPISMPWSSALQAHSLTVPLAAGRHHFQYAIFDVCEKGTKGKKEKKDYANNRRGNWGVNEEENTPKEEAKPKVEVKSEIKLDPTYPTENLADRGLVNYLDIPEVKLDAVPEKKE